MSNLIDSLYSSAEFERAARVWTDKLTEYFAELPSEKVWPATAPAAVAQRAAAFLEAAPGENRFEDLLDLFLESIHRVHHPSSMGHQVAPPLPIPALFEATGALTNQGGAVFEMSPFSLAVERVVTERLGKKLWPQGGFDGVMTHGGSAANFTALAAARQVHLPRLWTEGAGASKRPAVIGSRESHYSVSRAVGILGLGTQNFFPAEIDSERRMTGSTVAAAFDRAAQNGAAPFVVVASAGATPTGSFDDLTSIGAFCRERGLWFHVDACHGGSVLFSERLRELAQGIELADSVSWDCHKLMFLPALTTFIFFRQAAHSQEAFKQYAPYLWDDERNIDRSFDTANKTLECTKRSLAIGLWCALALYGEDGLGEMIDTVWRRTKELYTLLEQQPDFRPSHRPQGNILCFEYSPEGSESWSDERSSRVQRRLRQKLIGEGHFYITSTILDGRTVLRVTVMNPRTSSNELQGLVERLRTLGRELVAAERAEDSSVVGSPKAGHTSA